MDEGGKRGREGGRREEGEGEKEWLATTESVSEARYSTHLAFCSGPHPGFIASSTEKWGGFSWYIF